MNRKNCILISGLNLNHNKMRLRFSAAGSTGGPFSSTEKTKVLVDVEQARRETLRRLALVSVHSRDSLHLRTMKRR